jgi:hypothetical protein
LVVLQIGEAKDLSAPLRTYIISVNVTNISPCPPRNIYCHFSAHEFTYIPTAYSGIITASNDIRCTDICPLISVTAPRPHSVYNTSTRLWAGLPRSRGLFPGKGKGKIRVEIVSIAHAASYLVGTGAVSPAVKMTTQMVWCLIKYFTYSTGDGLYSPLVQ